MHIHFLGICGTFMGSLSILAAKLGHTVTGQDAKVYPPMSTQLTEQGIALYEGYDLAGFEPGADVVVVGNVMKRGMPVIEQLLNSQQKFLSGPQFLAEYVLQYKHVLVVSGTHGKTTTTSMLAWILEYAGLNPGFLIGGVPKNFAVSARLTDSPYFVIEGDEYDSAFFDKRSKFLHYRPSTLIINNLEYDHADIFRDVLAIQDQFHHLVRIVPESGCIIAPIGSKLVDEVLVRGCWSKLQRFGVNTGDWQLANISANNWPFFGEFNYLNAMASIAAAVNIGVDQAIAIKALTEFTGVKRRCEVVAQYGNTKVYSDFAHHPTAIKSTLDALREKIQNKHRILAVVDICSNTMRSLVHKDALGPAVAAADKVYFYHSKPIDLDVAGIIAVHSNIQGVYQDEAVLVAQLMQDLQDGDQIMLMSNGALVGIEGKLQSYKPFNIP